MVDDMVTTEWISDIWWNCSKVMKYFEPWWWWHVRCVQAIIKSISSTWHAKGNKKKHSNKGAGGGNPDAPVQMIDHFANARGKRDPFIHSGILLVRVCMLTTIICKTQLGKLLKTQQEIISLCSLCMSHLTNY
jgi:hypothetical protein